MSEHTKHQIISDKNGNPLFALVPYDEYVKFLHFKDEATIPNDVVERMVMGGKSVVRAWREHLKLSQKEVSGRMEITQAAYSQMENSPDTLRKDTLEKIAQAMGISYEQLSDL
jgi:ribosome-binding protein aMBF1 (putative translation factor)